MLPKFLLVYHRAIYFGNPKLGVLCKFLFAGNALYLFHGVWYYDVATAYRITKAKQVSGKGGDTNMVSKLPSNHLSEAFPE